MNAPDQFLSLNIGEAEIRVPREAAVLAYLEQIVDQRRPLPVAFAATLGGETITPAIGAKYLGGIYAGATIHEKGPMALVLLPGEGEDLTWEKAQAWAKEAGGELPTRIDQLVLWNNLKGEFKDAWYWSCGQHASDSDSAWTQTFGYGNQGYGLKSSKGRARAVRRVPL